MLWVFDFYFPTDAAVTVKVNDFPCNAQTPGM